MKAGEASEIHGELELTDSNSGTLAKVGDTKENVVSKIFAEPEAIKAVPGLGVSAKKTYSKPVLKLYGTVETITATVSNNSSNNDGGVGTMSKTH